MHMPKPLRRIKPMRALKAAAVAGLALFPIAVQNPRVPEQFLAGAFMTRVSREFAQAKTFKESRTALMKLYSSSLAFPDDAKAARRLWNIAQGAYRGPMIFAPLAKRGSDKAADQALALEKRMVLKLHRYRQSGDRKALARMLDSALKNSEAGVRAEAYAAIYNMITGAQTQSFESLNRGFVATIEADRKFLDQLREDLKHHVPTVEKDYRVPYILEWPEVRDWFLGKHPK